MQLLSGQNSEVPKKSLEMSIFNSLKETIEQKVPPPPMPNPPNALSMDDFELQPPI